ncbi:hypothetical protein [Evansella clarkii]|uniref:hypothetical protein n=1 Tax=Evansella clarkii TaxID=79879 RepID=UPI0009975CBC|nr:hypothetical protein [Evansella clarkii]
MEVESTGHTEKINETRQVLFSSSDFRSVVQNLDGKINRGAAVIDAPEDLDATGPYNLGIVSFAVEGSSEGLTSVTFYVDLNNQEVLGDRQHFINPNESDRTVDLKIKDNGETVADLTVNEQNVTDNLTSDTYTHEEYLEVMANQSGEFQTASTCEWAIQTLAGATSAFQCGLWCLGLAFTGPWTSIGCGVLCTMLIGYPVSEAVSDFC